jgi:transposase-like protein
MELGAYDPKFHDPLVAADYLASVRWANGKPVCPHCGEGERRHYPLKSTTRRLWKCAACRKQFSVTVGTIFESSHIGLHKWLYAFWLLCSSKKGMSAHQLHRMLGVTYKTAWFMAHRIRYAMEQPAALKLTGTVEVDETYVGGKRRRPNKREFKPLRATAPDKRKRKTGRGTDKTAVVALVERGGDLRSERIARVTGETLGGAIRRHVGREAHLRTDSFPSYTFVGREYASHETVDHLYEYVRGDAHTNTAENFFSILKRGIDGVYHHVSPAHLPRYLSEFTFRYNSRQARGYDDEERTRLALSMVEGKRLTYQM